MILGLDLSSKASGYTVLDKDGKIVDIGVITASSKDMIARAIKMAKELDKVIEKYDITKVVMEEVQPSGFQSTLNVAKALFTVQAGVRFLLHEKYPKIKIEFLMASSWRSQIGIHTGRGIKREELKRKDIEKANELYGLNLTSDDAADSCLLATVLYNKNKNEIN